MNCNKVSHLLSAYMDSELLGYEHRLIHQHLRLCSKCQSEYEELLHMKRLLAAMRVREPAQDLAASIVRRVTERPSSVPASQFNGWRLHSPQLRSRSHVYSPMVGLGIGLSVCGLLLWARPSRSSDAAADDQPALRLRTADVTQDEPAPRVSELTNGLIREEASRPFSFEPRYSENLPDFSLGVHRALRQSKPVMPVSYFR